MGAGGTFDAEKAGGATSPKQSESLLSIFRFLAVVALTAKNLRLANKSLKQSENLLSIFRFLAVQALNSGPDRDHYPGPCLQAVKGCFGLYMSLKIRE